jgi:phage-related minor tail protein
MEDIASLGLEVASDKVREAGKDLDGFVASSKMADASAKALRLTIGLTVAAFGALAGATALFVHGTIEAERAQNKLKAVLEATAGVAGRTADELNRMSSALQSATVFDDESITNAQSILLTFRNVRTEVFDRAIEGALDLSTVLGGDLNSAVLQLGKALNDPILGVTALSRAGVQFSEVQKEMIKDLVETNRLADAQAIILDELEGQMGGEDHPAL